jgi:hypothetical protein
MESHIKLLGVLFIVFGILTALLGLFLFAVLGGAGLISGDETALFVTGTVGVVLAGVFLVLAIPAIVAGVGLQRHREWARIVALVIAALNVLAFPFGTALAVYAFWVLLNAEATNIFSRPQQLAV